MKVFLALFIFIILGSISKRIMDVLYFDFKNSKFSLIKNTNLLNWFNPKESWRNKYKNRNPKDGPKFFGSTTVFVWTTDGWHFFQSLMLTSFEIAILIPTQYFMNFNKIYESVLFLIAIKLLRGITFEIFTNLLKKHD